MRTYEALYIIQPETAEDEVQTIATGVQALITEDGGAIVRSEIWGKRRLAYEVKGFKEGVYVLERFQASAPTIEKLRGHCRLNESIVRSLIVHFDEKTLRLEEEQAKRNAAQLAARAAEADGTARRVSRDSDGDDEPVRRRASEDAKPEVAKADEAVADEAKDEPKEETADV